MPSLSRLLLLCLLPSCAGRSVREALSPEGEVSRVEIQVDVGDVVVRTGPALRVERTLWGLQQAHEISHRTDGGVLHLEGRCVPWLPCAVHTTVEVPAGVAVSVQLAEGSADLAAGGPVVAAVGVGDLQIRPAPGFRSRVVVARGDVHAEVAEPGWMVSADSAALSLSGVQEGEGGASQLDVVAPAGQVLVTRTPSVAGR